MYVYQFSMYFYLQCSLGESLNLLDHHIDGEVVGALCEGLQKSLSSLCGLWVGDGSSVELLESQDKELGILERHGRVLLDLTIQKNTVLVSSKVSVEHESCMGSSEVLVELELGQSGEDDVGQVLSNKVPLHNVHLTSLVSLGQWQNEHGVLSAIEEHLVEELGVNDSTQSALVVNMSGSPQELNFLLSKFLKLVQLDEAVEVLELVLRNGGNLAKLLSQSLGLLSSLFKDRLFFTPGLFQHLGERIRLIELLESSLNLWSKLLLELVNRLHALGGSLLLQLILVSSQNVSLGGCIGRKRSSSDIRTSPLDTQVAEGARIARSLTQGFNGCLLEKWSHCVC